MKNYLNLVIFFLVLLNSNDIISQGSVGIGTTNPDSSAILDVQSTDRGLLIPRMSTFQRNNMPSLASGLVVYDTDLKTMLYYNGSQWVGLRDVLIDIDGDSKVSIGDGIDTDQFRVILQNKELVLLSTNVHGVATLELKNNFPNLFIGELAGKNTVPDTATFAVGGRDNTFVGYHTGSDNIKGSENTFVGDEAGRDMINGYQNTYIGADAGRVDTSGIYNTFIGAASAWFNKSGRYNTFLGRASGLSNLTGSSNTFIGMQAGWANENGSKNTYLGESSGFSNTSDSMNIFIGYGSGFPIGKSNVLAIDNSSTSSPLIYGDFANDTVKIYGSLSIKDEYSFPTLDGTAGQILKTDGSGSLSWTLPNSVMELNDLIDAKSDYTASNLFGGQGSGNAIVPGGQNNTGWGKDALNANSTGDDNTAVGQQALFTNQTGEWNTALGARALQNNTANYNTAIGRETLKDNSTGIENTAVGSQALWKNMGGNYNTAVGEQAMIANTSGDNNVGLGNNALAQNLIGNNNTAIGSGALENSLTDYNTAIGFMSLQTNTSGMLNVAIGNNAMQLSNIGEQNSAVGNLALQKNLANFNSAFGSASLISNTNGEANSAFGTTSLESNISGNHNVAMGISALSENTFGNQNVAIGAFALYSNINKSDNVAVGDSALFSNGVSVNSLHGVDNVGIGASALKNNTNGSQNTGVGSKVLYNNTEGDKNTAIGSEALLSNTLGTLNTAVGANAMKNNVTGNLNSAFGSHALEKSNSVFNAAFGENALKNSTSFGNSSFGVYSSQSLISGQDNTVIGTRALEGSKFGDQNVVMGYNAFSIDSTGDQNTIIGTEALVSSLAASNNTVIGYQAGFNTLGGGNVFLGYKAGFSETGSHHLYIDNTDTSDPLIWGDFIGDSLTVNGYLTSTQKFEAKSEMVTRGQADFFGISSFYDLLYVSNSDSTNYVFIDSTSISTMPVSIGGTPQDLWLQSTSSLFSNYGDVRLPSTTFLGIGTFNSPTHSLTIESSDSETVRLIGSGTNGAEARMNFGDADFVYIDEPSDDLLRIQATAIGLLRAPVVNALELEGNASKTTAGNWLANSDRRIKTNVQEIGNSFDILKNLRPVTFNYTEEWKELHPSIADKQYYNFIAQEYGEVFPSSIQGSGEYLPNDDQEILQIDTYDAQIVTIQAVKDLIKQNEGLKEEINMLKASLDKLTSEVTALISHSTISKSNE